MVYQNSGTEAKQHNCTTGKQKKGKLFKRKAYFRQSSCLDYFKIIMAKRLNVTIVQLENGRKGDLNLDT